MEEYVLASWIHDPERWHTGVSYEPLQPGGWEDQQWHDQQTSRCSNDRKMQIPFGGMNAIQWVVESANDNPNDITFNVSIDMPGDDPVAWPYQSNGAVVSAVLPENIDWNTANQRGFYIASVAGATNPYTLKAVAAKQ